MSTLALVGGKNFFSWSEKSWSKILDRTSPILPLPRLTKRNTLAHMGVSGFRHQKNIYLSTFKNTRTMAMKVKARETLIRVGKYAGTYRYVMLPELVNSN